MADNLSSSFALDVNSVTRLKYSANGDRGDGTKAAAKQFEAMFLQQMLKSMRDAIPKSDLLKSAAGDNYQQMMDAQWSQTLAQRGIGLADMLTRQLGAQDDTVKPRSDAPEVDPLAGFARAAPQALHASQALAGTHAQHAADNPGGRSSGSQFADGPSLIGGQAGQPLFGLGADDSAAQDGELPGYVSDFLDRIGPAAKEASAQSGLPKELILAQAALESGWGRHEITQANGQASHNIFSIKSTGWSGESTRVRTTEYANGEPLSTQAGFRVYGSYDQAFSDYARLLTQSPRYAPVLRATTAEAAARALQDCGYATDPAYARKLVSIMQKIPAESSPALFDNGHARPVVDLAARGSDVSGSLMASVDRDENAL